MADIQYIAIVPKEEMTNPITPEIFIIKGGLYSNFWN